MSRVYYENETIQKAMSLLDDLEQTIGFNMRCAYQGNYREGEDFHQEAMSALVEILEHCLDGPEHGARITLDGTPSHRS